MHPSMVSYPRQAPDLPSPNRDVITTSSDAETLAPNRIRLAETRPVVNDSSISDVITTPSDLIRPVVNNSSIPVQTNRSDTNGCNIAAPTTALANQSGTHVPNIDASTVPDVHSYQQKKTWAQGMMDLALLSANANQLRYVLETDPTRAYYYASLILLSSSLFLQVAVGVGLCLNCKFNVQEESGYQQANRVNNFTVIGIFIVTVVNVFISVFVVTDHQAPNTNT